MSAEQAEQVWKRGYSVVPPEIYIRSHGATVEEIALVDEDDVVNRLNAYEQREKELRGELARKDEALRAVCDELDAATNRDDLGYIKAFMLPILRAALAHEEPA